MRLLLDTHIWLWWLTGSADLSDAERQSIDRCAGRQQTCLAAISLWEAQMLHLKKRIKLPLPFAQWLRRAGHPDVVTVLPLDPEVVIALDALPSRFHGDPADRLIVATARAHGLPLATHDRTIRKSKTVECWKADATPPPRRQVPRRTA